MKISCPRCSGTGKLPKFRHVENGVCFLCGGAKEIECKDINLPESAVVCYQDNRNVTSSNGVTWREEWKIERFSIVVNGGSANKGGWDYVASITNENRDALRELWKTAKKAGCECRSFR